jgi:hypothetical protein
MALVPSFSQLFYFQESVPGKWYCQMAEQAGTIGKNSRERAS